MKNLFLFTVCLLLSLNTVFAQEVDCFNQLDNSSIGEVEDLWKNIQEINEPLYLAATRNRERYIEFIEFMQNIQPGQYMSVPIKLMHTIATLADTADGNHLELSRDTVVEVLNAFSASIYGEADFTQMLPPGNGALVNAILEQVESVEISHIRSGKYKGEPQIKLNNVGGKKMKIDLAALALPGGMSAGMNMANLTIDDGADIMFHDNETDRNGKPRDERVLDLIEDVRSQPLQSLPGFHPTSKSETMNYVQSRSYSEDQAPVYFKIDGFRMTTGSMGIGGKVTEGVLLPNGIDGNLNHDRNLYVKVKGTGMLGLASLVGGTVAL